MVVIAFVLRFALITIGHTYRFKNIDNNFSFGWEMGRIGRSLAEGQGFANPFNEPTGPTAWEPPLYPFGNGHVAACHYALERWPMGAEEIRRAGSQTRERLPA
mgnify:CR=1 FL=1